MSGVFVDSSVFLKILEGNERARDLIVGLIGQENLYRNTVVYSEVVYVWIKLATGRRSYELRKIPEYFKVLRSDFAKVKSLLDLAQPLPLNREIEDLSVNIMDSYGLLPNDALIAATCRHYGIRKIATFDEDFKRVDFLEVVEP